MSRRRRAKAEEGAESGPGMERWLLTYSDMITLLLALFVILFALSTINAQKFRAFELGLTKSFSSVSPNKQASGLLKTLNSIPHPTVPSAIRPAAAAPPPTSTPSLSQIAAEINHALTAAGLSSDASTTVMTQGVVVQMLADKAYFANDSATLGPIGDRIVDVIASVLRTIPNDVSVQGYTDSVPIIGGPFTSNWELSAVRAANVVQRLSTTDGITKNRLSAIGYATTHPAAPNTTASNQAKNRRIDVIVLTAHLTTIGPVSTLEGPTP